MKNEERKSIRVGVAAAVVCVLLLVSMRFVLGMWRPDGGSGKEPDFYRGPVLPLTAISGAEGLTVQRTVDFDFSPYAEEKGSVLASNEAVISDTYYLTNPGVEAVTVELAYPFEGRLNEESKYLPSLTLDGKPLETRRLASTDPARLIETAKTWEDFRDAVTENNYLTEALTPAVEWDEPVVVYAVTDIQYQGAEELEYPELVLTYDAPSEGVEVWDYMLGSTRPDDETKTVSKGFMFHMQDWGLLMVRGGDIENLRFQAYSYVTVPGENEIEDVTYGFERYETTFSEVIRAISQYHSPEFSDLLYAGTMNRLADQRYYTAGVAWKNFIELFNEILRENVILYDAFTLTIQPGETLELNAVFRQQAGTENSGFGTAADTYDMATRLGSVLEFTVLGATISNSDLIRITEQNFGFDLDTGVTEVTLDPNTERYYIRVAEKGN